MHSLAAKVQIKQAIKDHREKLHDLSLAIKQRYDFGFKLPSGLFSKLIKRHKQGLLKLENIAIQLNEGKLFAIKPFRPLTFAERRIEFDEIGDWMNQHGEQVKELLISITEQQKQAFLKNIEAALKDQDIEVIKDLTTRLSNQLRVELRDKAKEALDVGKSEAGSEINVTTPPTPTLNSKVLNAQIESIVKERNDALVAETKKTVLENVSTGVGIAALLLAVEKIFDQVANKYNQSIAGIVTTQYFNIGRSIVFDRNIQYIYGLQRSELLDSKTCAMCLSIDGRVIAPNNPFKNLGLVHSNCRGIWVSILKTDAQLPPVKELPKGLKDRFQVIEGVPSTNNFNQLKTPLINKESRAGQKVQDGDLDSNPNIS